MNICPSIWAARTRSRIQNGSLLTSRASIEKQFHSLSPKIFFFSLNEIPLVARPPCAARNRPCQNAVSFALLAFDDKQDHCKELVCKVQAEPKWFVGKCGLCVILIQSLVRNVRIRPHMCTTANAGIALHTRTPGLRLPLYGMSVCCVLKTILRSTERHFPLTNVQCSVHRLLLSTT